MGFSQVAKFDFIDVGGSLNDGQPPTALAPNEWQQLWNMYQFGTKLIRRGGMERETDTPAGENITGLHVLNKVDGSRFLMAGGITQIYRQDGDDLVAVPKLEGGLHNPTTLPWVTDQYNDTVYWMRADNGGLRRGSSDFVQNAGIVAPTTAAVLASGGAGDLTAGNYIAVVTFYNSATGVESNPSPVSNTLALGASEKIDWSGIPVSSNPQVNARRLYRTVPNQTGRYFFVAQINDNSTTTYTGDNVTVQDLGRPASFRNGLPPAALELGAVWKERMFASDGIDQFFSEPGNMEAFDPNAVIPVFRNDGHRISANHAFGDRLIIGKTNKVHYLLGTDPSDFSLHTLSDKHGCWSHHSMKSAEGNLFWYGGDNVYRSDGTSAYSISTIKVQGILAGIPETLRAYVVGAIWPKRSWYMLSIPAVPAPPLEGEEPVQRVVNPGAEDEVVDPWVDTGDFAVTVVSNPSFGEGDFVFQLTESGENHSSMEQEIDPEDEETATVAVTAVGPANTASISFFAYNEALELYLQPDGTWGAAELPWATHTGATWGEYSVVTTTVAGIDTVLLYMETDGDVDNNGDFLVDEYTWTTGEVTDDSITNRTILIYNYKTDVWTQFTYQPFTLPAPPAAMAPAFILSDFNEDDEPTLYAAFYDGRVWRLEAGLTDDGNRFSVFLSSGDHDFGAVGLVKFLQRVYILCTRLTSLVDYPTVGVTMDGSDGATKSRVVDFSDARPWKRLSMSTLHRPSYTMSVFLSYEGSEHLEISGYAMEVLVQPRSLQPR